MGVDWRSGRGVSSGVSATAVVVASGSGSGVDIVANAVGEGSAEAQDGDGRGGVRHWRGRECYLVVFGGVPTALIPNFRLFSSPLLIVLRGEQRAMASLSRVLVRRTPPTRLHGPHSPPPGIHLSARRHALTKFGMPAMSPTMSEGGISQWKKKDGDSFSAGDVLLEIVGALSCPLPFLTVFRAGNGQGYH